MPAPTIHGRAMMRRFELTTAVHLSRLRSLTLQGFDLLRQTRQIHRVVVEYPDNGSALHALHGPKHDSLSDCGEGLHLEGTAGAIRTRTSRCSHREPPDRRHTYWSCGGNARSPIQLR